MRPRGWPISRSPRVWTAIPTASAADDDGSAARAWTGCRTSRARVARAVFPPGQVAEVVAVACELPARHDRPLGRFSRTELHRLVIEQGVTDASATTIWRWLHDRSLKPWQQRSWIFPRDPDFQPKAGRVLDLYARRFEGRRLHPGEGVSEDLCRHERTGASCPRRSRPVSRSWRRAARVSGAASPEGERSLTPARAAARQRAGLGVSCVRSSSTTRWTG